MVELRTLNISPKRRKHTPLKPVLFSTAERTSILFLMKRYLEMKSDLVDLFSRIDPHLLDLLLSPSGEVAAEKLKEDMKILNSVTVALHSEKLDL